MAAVVFNINTMAISDHVSRLERINRSALPVAVRQTLNAAAFDVKQNTMPEEADIFIHRKPTFFKANSGVTPAKGLDVNTMEATVGFKPKTGDRSHSVEDLEEQEEGGVIPHSRAFVALKEGRTGQQWQKNTMMKNREMNIGTAIDSKNAPGKNSKQQFIKSAYLASKQGKLLIGNRETAAGNKIAWRVKPTDEFNKDENKKFVLSRVFAVKKGRQVDPKATHFMRKASDETQGKMEEMFIKNAEAKIAQVK